MEQPFGANYFSPNIGGKIIAFVVEHRGAKALVWPRRGRVMFSMQGGVRNNGTCVSMPTRYRDSIEESPAGTIGGGLVSSQDLQSSKTKYFGRSTMVVERL